MKLGKSGGRGKKQCPNCKNYMGVRTSSCPECLHEFKSRPKVNKVATVFHREGKGRKPCPECNKFVGARVCECPCGHKFEIGKAKKVIVQPPTQDEEEARNFVKQVTGNDEAILGSNVVLSPSGKCPIQLCDTNESAVFEWCDALFFHGCREKKLYAPSAYRYFVRDFYPMQSDEHSRVVKLVNSWLDNKCNKEN